MNEYKSEVHMKIGIMNYIGEIYKKVIKFQYTVESEGKRQIVQTNEDFAVGDKVPSIFDIGTQKHVNSCEILRKDVVYQEVDLDDEIDFNLLNASMVRIPLSSKFLVDLVKAIKKLWSQKYTFEWIDLPRGVEIDHLPDWLEEQADNGKVCISVDQIRKAALFRIRT